MAKQQTRYREKVVGIRNTRASANLADCNGLTVMEKKPILAFICSIYGHIPDSLLRMWYDAPHWRCHRCLEPLRIWEDIF